MALEVPVLDKRYGHPWIRNVLSSFDLAQRHLEKFRDKLPAVETPLVQDSIIQETESTSQNPE